MKLVDLLKAVRDESLSLQMLEKYRDELTHFRTDILIEIASLKKRRAFFLVESEEPSAIAKKQAWDVTTEGQRLLELEGYIRGLGSEIEALTARVYAAIR